MKKQLCKFAVAILSLAGIYFTCHVVSRMNPLLEANVEALAYDAFCTELSEGGNGYTEYDCYDLYRFAKDVALTDCEHCRKIDNARPIDANYYKKCYIRN